MIYSIESSSYIKNIPHLDDYRRWKKGLTNTEYQDIYSELLQRIDGSQIETSSWIPGSDWTGTVFQPIYENGCHCDERAAAKFFGLVLWHVIMDHEQVWAFGRYKLGDIPIEGLTYFRIDKP